MSGRTTTDKGLGYEWQQFTIRVYEVYPPVCWICKQGIDLDLDPKHRLSKTVHHLDPRAGHGTKLPSIDRVRPAHRACNSRQGSDEESPPLRWVL